MSDTKDHRFVSGKNNRFKIVFAVENQPKFAIEHENAAIEPHQIVITIDEDTIRNLIESEQITDPIKKKDKRRRFNGLCDIAGRDIGQSIREKLAAVVLAHAQ